MKEQDLFNKLKTTKLHTILKHNFKRLSFIVLACFISISLFGQEPTGVWSGVLKLPGKELRIAFTITEKDGVYTSTMDSPDQGAKGIPVTKTTYKNSQLLLEIPAGRIQYKASINNEGLLEGTFSQAGHDFPLTLNKGTVKKKTTARPQEPTKPHAYISEDIRFENTKDNISLAGTLTMPKTGSRFPAVILISGSGPQNRDEELLGHKPFLILADHLTRNGFAVLRYDDRGVAQSGGSFKTATSADFATDARAAIEYLKSRKEIDAKKIGFIGHSEGGLIAPMVAAETEDVAFIVMLGGPGIRGDKIILLQQELIAKVSGSKESDIKKKKELNAKLFNMVVRSKNDAKLKLDIENCLADALKDMPDEKREAFIARQVSQVTSPWMKYFLKREPSESLVNVQCPVLALNGEKDLQVPSKVNLDAIKYSLDKAKNKNYVVKELAGLNHLFQECETGLPTEYAVIEQTFSPVALNEISDWLRRQVR